MSLLSLFALDRADKESVLWQGRNLKVGFSAYFWLRRQSAKSLKDSFWLTVFSSLACILDVNTFPSLHCQISVTWAHTVFSYMDGCTWMLVALECHTSGGCDSTSWQVLKDTTIPEAPGTSAGLSFQEQHLKPSTAASLNNDSVYHARKVIVMESRTERRDDLRGRKSNLFRERSMQLSWLNA